MYKLKVIFDISIEVDSNFLFEYLLDLIIILIEFVELKFIGRQFFYLFKLFLQVGGKLRDDIKVLYERVDDQYYINRQVIV